MKAAVLGKPIAHSMSAVLHRAAYVALGFDPSPQEPMTLMVTLNDIRAALS